MISSTEPGLAGFDEDGFLAKLIDLPVARRAEVLIHTAAIDAGPVDALAHSFAPRP